MIIKVGGGLQPLGPMGVYAYVDVQFYVRPLLEYCSCVWSAHFKDGIYKVESVQRNFTKRLIGRNVSLVVYTVTDWQHLTCRFRVTVSALLSLVGPAHQLLLPLAAFKCDVF